MSMKITKEEALYWSWQLWKILGSKGKANNKITAKKELMKDYITANEMQKRLEYIFSTSICPCCTYVEQLSEAEDGLTFDCSKCPGLELWGTVDSNDSNDSEVKSYYCSFSKESLFSKWENADIGSEKERLFAKGISKGFKKLYKNEMGRRPKTRKEALLWSMRLWGEVAKNNDHDKNDTVDRMEKEYGQRVYQIFGEFNCSCCTYVKYDGGKTSKCKACPGLPIWKQSKYAFANAPMMPPCCGSTSPYELWGKADTEKEKMCHAEYIHAQFKLLYEMECGSCPTE